MPLTPDHAAARLDAVIRDRYHAQGVGLHHQGMIVCKLPDARSAQVFYSDFMQAFNQYPFRDNRDIGEPLAKEQLLFFKAVHWQEEDFLVIDPRIVCQYPQRMVDLEQSAAQHPLIRSVQQENNPVSQLRLKGF